MVITVSNRVILEHELARERRVIVQGDGSRGGELFVGDFQSPWKTVCGSLLKPGALAPPTS